jgi:uncharacterized NAD-dependent epimerase/dehydratase family protein
VSVVDSEHAGSDAGEILDGRNIDIPIEANIETAVNAAIGRGLPATHLVIGIAPDGGRLDPAARSDVRRAVDLGLHVVSGLHDYLSDDPELMELAHARGITLHDVRKPKPTRELKFFTGKIEEVDSLKVAILGTDSAIGKRTTAWLLADELEARGVSAEMVGTGQTAWLQGARFSIILDSIVNDFVAGEIEHAVWSAWSEQRPEVIIIEGQGSLMNPAYPGGFEILAAGRPDLVVLQHAPARLEYDGFPGNPMHPLERQIEAIELISGRPVVAVTLNHEGLSGNAVEAACSAITAETGLPAFDVLRDGAGGLAEVVIERRRR